MKLSKIAEEIEKRPYKHNYKCVKCFKRANIVETDPYGPDLYFCSEKCRQDYTNEAHEKTQVWIVSGVYALNEDGSHAKATINIFE
jgi:endogenous inhibitor of DNA gyrase (YacG/DUF329 family)